MPGSWRWVSDRAVVRAFPDESLAEANATALSLYRQLRALSAPEVEDIVPGARSVLVVLRPRERPGPEVRALLEQEEPAAGGEASKKSRVHEITVSYGGKDGPDLRKVAALHGLSEQEVVAMHSSPAYIVGFIGFAPGFPYLLGLDERLETPRLKTPRTKVAAGSVGIGGIFTGIYPRTMPGGWRVIGRTGVELFDPSRPSPALLAPGDRVRFVAS